MKNENCSNVLDGCGFPIVAPFWGDGKQANTGN